MNLTTPTNREVTEPWQYDAKEAPLNSNSPKKKEGKK